MVATRFSTELTELSNILRSADLQMAWLWKHASPEQRARLDALDPFDFHDPKPVAKAASALANAVENEANSEAEALEDEAVNTDIAAE